MERLQCADSVSASVRRGAGIAERAEAPAFLYTIECRDRNGRVRWRERVRNLVTVQGKDYALQQLFSASSYTAAWYVGLIDSVGFSSVSDSDTMAAHPGWAENSADYSQSTRQALTLGTPNAAQADNSLNLATFTINAPANIQGAFVATQATKGGTGGILYSASSFGTPRAVVSGDIMTVKITLAL